jgi:hypothetical protein
MSCTGKQGAQCTAPGMHACMSGQEPKLEVHLISGRAGQRAAQRPEQEGGARVVVAQCLQQLPGEVAPAGGVLRQVLDALLRAGDQDLGTRSHTLQQQPCSMWEPL